MTGSFRFGRFEVVGVAANERGLTGRPAMQDERTDERGAAGAPGRQGSDELALRLYEKLNNGDADAVEKLFLAYEPQLRTLVRRQLPQSYRAKFDSSDVMQSVWTSVLQGLREESWRFTGEAHLRAFLVRMALFRFIDLCRHHRNSLGRERPLGVLDATRVRAAPNDQPSEIMQAHELLDRLLEICPPAHHELVRLRALGYPLAEIAARTGFHESSIRRIFYDLARRLDAQDGGVQEGPRAAGAGLRS
jgi:RNA polymerase sigma-70 factor (ECF subfamily)